MVIAHAAALLVDGAAFVAGVVLFAVVLAIW